ncbi:hypothetical protein [Actinomadura yumaensis]|uniref:Uncharacterized protein n=1 Tax=Actinomadura yumaensis TaxID=111807 RepID=A0ABW2CMZ1_9ACTN
MTRSTSIHPVSARTVSARDDLSGYHPYGHPTGSAIRPAAPSDRQRHPTGSAIRPAAPSGRPRHLARPRYPVGRIGLQAR